MRTHGASSFYRRLTHARFCEPENFQPQTSRGIEKWDTRKPRMAHDALVEMAKPSTTPTPALDDWMQRADDFARQEPAKAVVSAFGAGFLLNLLPLSAIAAALVGVAFTLVRPALLFLGLFKACELYREKTQTIERHE